MTANNIKWAFAVGMKDTGGYSLEAYADYIRSASQKVFPIAYYDFNESDTGREITSKLENISRCGYLSEPLRMPLPQTKQNAVSNRTQAV